MNPTSKRTAGMTLVEVVVLLVVIALAVTALAPAVLRLAAARKTNSTRDEMALLHRAIVGNPKEGNYGFLGDLGQLPASLADLVEAGAYPLHTMTTAAKVGIGWNGPYTMRTKEDALSDAFGRPYVYGGKEPGQIQSAGPDGQMDTNDDLFYPAKGLDHLGTVRIELIKAGAYAVRLYYSDGGVQKSLLAETQPYIFKNVHRGVHAVEILTKTDEELTLAHQTVIVLSGKTGVYMVDF